MINAQSETSAMRKLPPIVISSNDYDGLEKLLDSGVYKRLPGIDALYEELARATVVAPEKVPPGVVTMNSLVRCVDDATGKTFELSLVYPSQADISKGKISILAPVGSALLGLSCGQTIEWPIPAGHTIRLRVLEVLYQPESNGDYS